MTYFARCLGSLVPIALLAVVLSGAGCASVSPSEARTAAGRHVGGGEWFVQTGCTACHSVTVYGLWNPAVSAPDLSIAVEDVPKRFGRSLEDFLRAPTGTMAMVLSSRIILTDSGRLLAIERLEEAYALHQHRNAVTRPVASH